VNGSEFSNQLHWQTRVARAEKSVKQWWKFKFLDPLPPRLPQSSHKRYGSPNNKKNRSFCYAKSVGQLAYAPLGNYYRRARFNKKRAVGDYATNSCEHNSEDGNDDSQHLEVSSFEFQVSGFKFRVRSLLFRTSEVSAFDCRAGQGLSLTRNLELETRNSEL
jgi:hypothetical protein